MIYFTKYAAQKFELLKKHGVELDKETIKEIVNTPEKKEEKGRYEAAEKNNIKVIYKQEEDTKKIITFYPVK